MPDTKKCTTCGEEKPLNDFHERRKNRTKGGTPYLYVYVPNECSACEHRKRGEYRQTPEGRESDRAAHKRYYDTHKDDILAKGKTDEGRERHRVYNNSLEGKVRQARYEGTASGRINLVERRSRHRQVRSVAVEETVGRKLTARAWRTILRAYERHCAYCDKPLNDIKGDANSLTMDHVVPLTQGGEHAKTNVVPACYACNQAKGNELGWVPRPPKRAMKF